MIVLDLFSGLNGWSQPFKDKGHQTITVDIDPRFNADYVVDIRHYKLWFPNVDVILASPPCDAFSVMNINKNWTTNHDPKTPKALLGMELLHKTLEIIDEIKPKYFIIENPRDKMRKLPIMQQFERRTVTYCQYGEKRMKPTDLFGVFPPNLILKPPCKNGDSCHIRAPRGSKTGTQGMDKYMAAKIPYALSKDICIAIEADLGERLDV